MPSQRWRRVGGAAIAAFAAVVACLVVFWQPVARAAIVNGLAWTTGLHLSFAHLEVHRDRLLANEIHVENGAGEAIADVGSLKLQYSLRDLLPGSSRMFGLVGFDVENAHLIVTRHQDGTLNIPIPKKPVSNTPSSTPYVFEGLLRGASIDVYDQAQGVRAARHLVVRDVNAYLDVATNARSRYHAGLTYVEDGREFPIHGDGNVDVAGGVGLQRWFAPHLPIGRIADVALNSPSFHMAGGSLRDLDARIVGLAGEDGSLHQHVSATAAIDRARIAIGGLAKPLRNVNGRIAVYGDGLLLQNVNATIANVPIVLGGGVFHLGSPQFRLTVAGRGDFRDLRTVLAQTGSLHLNGAARLNVTVEGAPSKPLTLIGLQSPRVTYGSVLVDQPKGVIAFDGQEVDVLAFRARYGGIGLETRGRFNLHPKSNAVEMVAGFASPANSMPFVSAIVPGMPLRGTIVANGDRLSQVDTRGIVVGNRSGERLAATFGLRSNGVGTLGPIRVDGTQRSLYAIASVDHPHDRFDAYIDATNLRVDTASSPSLPGLNVSRLPSMAATIDGRVAGSLRGDRVQIAGSANLRDIQTPFANAARAHVRFGQTPHSPLTAGVDASGIGALGAVGTAMLSFARGTIRINDAAAATRGSFADARGDIANVQSGAPRYDLWANVHSVDLASLVAVAQPRAAGLIEGSAEARVHVSGSGRAPAIEGTAQLPEGAVNGLAFHDLRTSIHGTPASIALDNGRVGVGSTEVAFDAVAGRSSQRVSVAAPHADLADFNDFFDAGDVLGGEGHVRADVALAGGAIVATSGELGLHNAKLRSFDIGAANGSWHGGGNRVDTTLAFGGPFGRVSAAGSIGLTGSVDLAAHARDIDLSRWLPMAGIVVPVTGLARADVAAVGRYPDLDSRLSAVVTNGSVGRVPVTQFAVAATTTNGRGRISSATLVIPNARVVGSGTFGMHRDDALGMTFHATTPNVAALANTVTGKKFDAAGSLNSTLRVSGTLVHPTLNDDFALAGARYGKFDIPRAIGHVRADERTVTLSSSEIDLRKGRVEAQATLPIQLRPFQIDPRNRPVSASVVADDVEASNVVDLLPKGTTVGGRVDGRISLSGTVRSPQFAGTMTLAKGSFTGPQERVPITDATSQLVFSGTSARLQNARANAGGGTIDADASASIPNVRDVGRAAANLNLRARGARLDLPQYIKGRFNGDLHVARVPGARPSLSGTVAVDNARIPMTALYNPKSSNAAPATLPDLGMDMHVLVNRDVRVVSPNVDVGAQGAVHVMGTLAAPQLAGSFASTGGTVSFFRDFTIQSATVSFDPASGVIPDVDASATTFITNPDTNIALRVTGPATHLNLAFDSDPSYDREQILGLLVNAQSLGAVHGVQTTGSSPFSTSAAVSNLAAGQLNTIFTRNLLEPLSVAVGGSLGLQNLQITNDVQSGLGLNAVKTFGKNVSFVFADTFNEPRRQSWSLQAHPSDRTQFELTAYSSQGTSLLGYQPLLVQGLNMGSVATIPLDTGTNGVNVKVKRTFP